MENNTNTIKQEIELLRRELEEMYLDEKLNCAFISDKTVEYSQNLDKYIVEEQKRLFDEYLANKQAANM